MRCHKGGRDVMDVEAMSRWCQVSISGWKDVFGESGERQVWKTRVEPCCERLHAYADEFVLYPPVPAFSHAFYLFVSQNQLWVLFAFLIHLPHDEGVPASVLSLLSISPWGRWSISISRLCQIPLSFSSSLPGDLLPVQQHIPCGRWV